MSYQSISGYGTDPDDISLGMLEVELSNQLFSWCRADNVILNGGLVESWADKVALTGAVRPNARGIDPAHVFTQPSALLRGAPTTLAALNTREVVDFNLAPWYDSSFAADKWRFINSRGAFYCILVTKSFAAAAVRVIGGTEVSTSGFLAMINNSLTADATLRLRIRKNPAIPVIQLDTLTGGVLVGSPSLCKFSYQEGLTPSEAEVSGRGTAISGNSATAPVVDEVPNNTFRIGQRPSTATTELDAYVADFMFTSVVSPYIESLIKLYANLRYCF